MTSSLDIYIYIYNHLIIVYNYHNYYYDHYYILLLKTQAIKSEICQKHYDDAEMKSLLSLLASNAEALLLFTQNVTRIAVYHLPKHARGPADMARMLQVEKKPVEVVRELLPKVMEP